MMYEIRGNKKVISFRFLQQAMYNSTIIKLENRDLQLEIWIKTEDQDKKIFNDDQINEMTDEYEKLINTDFLRSTKNFNVEQSKRMGELFKKKQLFGKEKNSTTNIIKK